MKIMHVVGARPNFMKAAPILAAFSRRDRGIEQILVHTGQHHDSLMSDVFFSDLSIPEPTEHLRVSGGSHAEQTARIMLAFEPVLDKHRPDWLMVVGDVNSTLACALVAAKSGVPIAHVEAGLRSYDRSMPEEVNRIVTDALSNALLCPSVDALENLAREGIPREKMDLVGNVMIDTLIRMLPRAASLRTVSDLGLCEQAFVLATLHRPSNVDDPRRLAGLVDALNYISLGQPVVFPVHPRTRATLNRSGIVVSEGVRITDPLGYLEFLSIMASASLVITDSGGVQEETSYLGIPCLTARENTERPITITHGTNRLVQPNSEAIRKAYESVRSQERKARCAIPLWDGLAADRIVDVTLRRMSHDV